MRNGSTLASVKASIRAHKAVLAANTREILPTILICGYLCFSGRFDRPTTRGASHGGYYWWLSDWQEQHFRIGQDGVVIVKELVPVPVQPSKNRITKPVDKTIFRCVRLGLEGTEQCFLGSEDLDGRGWVLGEGECCLTSIIKIRRKRSKNTKNHNIVIDSVNYPLRRVTFCWQFETVGIQREQWDGLQQVLQP